MSNFFDEEIRDSIVKSQIRDKVSVLDDCTTYARKLSSKFKILGSKIDFDFNSSSVYYRSGEVFSASTAGDFIGRIAEEKKLKGSCIYFGDGLTSIALIFDLKDVGQCLDFVIEVPQHHYIVDDCFDWFFFLSFEGDMIFSFSNINISPLEKSQ